MVDESICPVCSKPCDFNTWNTKHKYQCGRVCGYDWGRFPGSVIHRANEMTIEYMLQTLSMSTARGHWKN